MKKLKEEYSILKKKIIIKQINLQILWLKKIEKVNMRLNYLKEDKNILKSKNKKKN